MTASRIVRADALTPTPWPNGRGVTRDILSRRRPDGSIELLISLADLTQDAPFSHLPDIDRTFTLVEGDPVVLLFEGFGDLPCGLLGPAFFPGDRPTACRLTGGAAKAFNVMVDRRIARASVRPLRVADGAGAPIGPDVVAIHCIDGTVETPEGDLDPRDTWIVPSGRILAKGGAAAVLVVEIAAV
jgi:environmental stress-induced protein Ves